MILVWTLWPHHLLNPRGWYRHDDDAIEGQALPWWRPGHLRRDGGWRKDGLGKRSDFTNRQVALWSMEIDREIPHEGSISQDGFVAILGEANFGPPPVPLRAEPYPQIDGSIFDSDPGAVGGHEIAFLAFAMGRLDEAPKFHREQCLASSGIHQAIRLFPS
jgi:hypothetical protein